eukprot:16828-Heterococcus_DN1.PRE.3
MFVTTAAAVQVALVRPFLYLAFKYANLCVLTIDIGAQQIVEEGEWCLYTVTILKGQYQAGFYDGEQFQPGMQVDYVDCFKKAAKEKRFTARQDVATREFKFDPERLGEIEREAGQLKVESQRQHTAAVATSTSRAAVVTLDVKFAAIAAAWIHIKLIRGFVESVLRYGLPIDFSTYLVDPVKGKDATILKALDEMYATVSSLGPQHDQDEEKEKHAPATSSSSNSSNSGSINKLACYHAYTLRSNHCALCNATVLDCALYCAGIACSCDAAIASA